MLFRSFQPAPALAVCRASKPPGAPEWLRLASFDGLDELRPRQGALGGLVVLAPRAPAGLTLHLEGPQGPVPLEWGLSSPWAAKRFPRSPNGPRARFASREVHLEGRFELCLTDPATGARHLCATLQAGPPDTEIGRAHV